MGEMPRGRMADRLHMCMEKCGRVSWGVLCIYEHVKAAEEGVLHRLDATALGQFPDDESMLS